MALVDATLLVRKDTLTLLGAVAMGKGENYRSRTTGSFVTCQTTKQYLCLYTASEKHNILVPSVGTTSLADVREVQGFG